MYDFRFADIGDGIEEGKILEWKVKVGDKVKEGDTLVIVETDKVNAELPSPVDGVITKVGKAEGEVILVGETVVVIDDGKGGDLPKAEAAAPAPKKEETKQAPVAGVKATYDFKFADIGDGIEEGKILEWKFKVGDKVKEGDTLVIVETDKVNAELPSPVTGTIVKIGKAEGEVIKVGETVVLLDDGSGKYIGGSDAKTEAVEENGASVIGELSVSSDLIDSSDETHKSEVKTNKKALATPVARNLAKKLGVNINEITGTGSNGRVMKEDIEKFANKGSKTEAPVAAKATTVNVPAANVSRQGDVTIEAITSTRKSISKAMTTAKTIIPETVLMDEVVIDNLIELRKRAKPLAEAQGINLTFMAFISKAVVIALKEFRIFNSSFDHDKNEIIYKNFINLGFAVDTPSGLIVPNIKDADTLSVFALAKQVRELADKAIARKVQLADIQNGTFTITNFGSVGVSYGTPVINYPEVAILGVGKISKKPIVVGDEIKIGSTLPLSIAVDHRIIDGADAGRFLLRVKELLSNPELMLLS
ncbi:2-oxo acid dehydrogenase subunit E2 [Haploplasma axanthum]|uniref:Dihydrolipoamide acetyltransferase component of pyruvate dehydrogenase complex n=1 Tax=Haploplasma axanthum TaxID=29552 RepID=A0A449BFW1_HAPAX|nr:2-oxo acid dehydrogenase subunit E2 [Haploplasma axanthum]VEU81316.1 branched-chain alpha-keto acid dehydrogenase subunit E2 [Haploplasma axanthum]